MFKSKIAGIGKYIPANTMTNEDLKKYMDTSDEWIQERTGIQERHYAHRTEETTTTMGVEAAKIAIERAGTTAKEIDFIIFATLSPDYYFPGCGVLVQRALAMNEIGALDIRNQCSGFVYALSIADQFIQTGMYKNILVIGSEKHSFGLDFSTRGRNISVIFGDGAGAAVLSHTENGKGLMAVDLYADGTGKFNFTIPAGGSEMPATLETVEKGLHKFSMNGKAVYDTATRVLPEAINNVLERCSLKIDDVKFLIPHQPSIRILKKTAEILGLPFEKVKTNMEHYANTSGGTIPILLDEVNRSGVLEDGDVIVFAAVGSGWTWGAAAMMWVK
jgi:3-oxoacyl-[acyl-carrier-protein] synthase-3